MLTRPFAPFRIRPVRRIRVQKTLDQGVIARLLEESAATLTSLPREARLIKPSPDRLRVLKRSAEK
jgi:hypothetical protein